MRLLHGRVASRGLARVPSVALPGMSGETGLEAVREALQAAVVAVHAELAQHVGWSGAAVDALLRAPAAAGAAARRNVSGDAVLALDDLADKHIEAALRACPLVAGFASEEREAFVQTSAAPEAQFIVVFDPLDGSQNVPPGLSVGSIFGVFRARSLGEVHSGDEIVAAG